MVSGLKKIKFFNSWSVLAFPVCYCGLSIYTHTHADIRIWLRKDTFLGFSINLDLQIVRWPEQLYHRCLYLISLFNLLNMKFLIALVISFVWRLGAIVSFIERRRSSLSSIPSVIVIGGGISGIAAAHTLHNASCEVIMLFRLNAFYLCDYIIYYFMEGLLLWSCPGGLVGIPG